VKEGAQKNKEDHINLSIPIKFDIQGAKLVALTQAIVYRGIKESKKTPTRWTTMENLKKACNPI